MSWYYCEIVKSRRYRLACNYEQQKTRILESLSNYSKRMIILKESLSVEAQITVQHLIVSFYKSRLETWQSEGDEMKEFEAFLCVPL